VEAQGVKVLVGFQFRFHPGIQAVKEAITESKIGRPFYVSAHWGEHLPGWHPWEDYRNSYAARQDLGGGVALTLCHPFDYLRWIFGAVESVMAQVDQLGPWDIPVEDHVNALLDFKLGLRGCVHLDYIQRPPEHSLKILGTEGTILWDNADGAAHISRADGEGWQSVPLHKGFERNDLFVEEMRHFLRVVAEGENPRCDLRDGIEALRIVEAVKAASQYGKRLFMADFPSSASPLDK
jgi:predicted dehydrogenase